MADSKPHAIMIAVPFQGHLNPFVHLAIKLASKGFTITFVHFEYAHRLISQSHPNSDSDVFSQARSSGLDIRYTTVSDGFPLEFDRDQNFVEYWETMFKNFPSRVDKLVKEIISSFDSSWSHCMVSDTISPWPGSIAKNHNLVNVSFWTEPSVVFAICHNLDLLRQNGHFPVSSSSTDYIDFMIDYIPGVNPIRMKDLMSYIKDPDNTLPLFKTVISNAFEEIKNADFVLHNTVQELEPLTISTLDMKQPTYAIGPVNFSTNESFVSKSMLSETDCVSWLNSKPDGSVLYVSFGSLVQINESVVKELARGLVRSEVRFVWAMRPLQVVGSVESLSLLPVGFEDEVEGRGLVVPWCNQTVVLSHAAVGGFVTHCGWNSVVESVWYGVPMICYPVMFDQPTNRKLVVDDWRVGVDLVDDGAEIDGDEVGKKIGRLMSGDGGWDGLRKEMGKFRSILRGAWGENGSSEINFDRFVEDLKDKMKPIIDLE